MPHNPENPYSLEDAHDEALQILEKKTPENTYVDAEQILERERDSMAFERSLVVDNPEIVGINFDQNMIVDGRNFWNLEQWIRYANESGKFSKAEIEELVSSGRARAMIAERNDRERQKAKDFNEYWEGFHGKINRVRINPAGEHSPISPSQALELKPDGSFSVKIPTEFLAQAKEIAAQCRDTTIVIPFYDHRRGKERASDIPDTPERVMQYLAIAEKMIDEVGGRIQIEIGNETNVSRNSGHMFADKLQHASRVDSHEYATFLLFIANNLKEKHPDVKISMAGVACYDPSYILEVLTDLKRDQCEPGNSKTLVDTISYHPYRDMPIDGAAEVHGGHFIKSDKDNFEQMSEMKRIASQFGVDVTIGEIGFPIADAEQKNKLRSSLEFARRENVASFIYPALNIRETPKGGGGV